MKGGRALKTYKMISAGGWGGGGGVGSGWGAGRPLKTVFSARGWGAGAVGRLGG